MKILLVAINAKYIHSNPAVHSLKAYAKAQGGVSDVEIEIAEYTINQPLEEIRSDLFRREPDVIGFSCYIWNRKMVEDLLPDLPQILPEAELWLGGPEVSYDTVRVLETLPVRGVMVGSGEASFLRLVQAYGSHRGDELPAVLQEEAVSLDEVPFWYQDLTDFEHRIIYYESSRGCPFSCAYCLSAAEKKLTFRSLEKVLPELQFFLDRRVPQVKFIDRTFNCRRNHALAIWCYLKEHDNGITNFHFEVAADLMDEEMLEVLGEMRPGAVQLEIGVQSTCSETLQAIHRPMDFARVAEVTQTIRSRRNIHQHLDLIAGLPREGYERFRESFDDVYGLQPDQLQLGFLKVLRGSPMAEACPEYDLQYTKTPPYEVLSTRWLSHREVLRLKDVEAVLEIYYNSGQFSHTIRRLEKNYNSAFALYEDLADWHREQGLFGIQSSRVKRYEYLLAFALLREPEAEQEYRELLTLDLYLREHMKNRPDFCPELERYKVQIRQWMDEAAAGHHTPEGYEGLNSRELARRLHVEVMQTVGEEPVLYIFDYQRRDPLTYNAKVFPEPLPSLGK